MIKKDNDRVVTYDPKTGLYSNSSNTIKIKNVYDARAYNKLLNEPTATPSQVNAMSKRIENARAYSATVKKEEGLFELTGPPPVCWSVATCLSLPPSGGLK